MKRYLLAIVLFFLYPLTAQAFIVSVRQGAFDKNKIEKPALLQFVHSADSTRNDNYLIDIGITMRWDTKRWALGPTAEYHRNTEISREQNNIQAGLTGIYVYGNVAEELTLYTQGSVKYKKDRIQTGQGILAKLNVTPLRPPWALGSDKDLGSEQLKFVWQPTIGIQYETASDVLETGQSGNVTRAFGNMEIGIFPFAMSLRRRLQVIARDSYWYNIDRTGGYINAYNKDHNLFQTSLIMYLDKCKHFGFGLDYFKGENPEQGLLKQETTMVSFKAKY